MVSGLPYLPPPPALAGKPNKPRFPPTQAAPSPPLSNTTSTVRGASTRLGSEGTDANEAATKLAEAIDDFLGDLEKKFKGISDEILTKCEGSPISPFPRPLQSQGTK